MFKDAIEFRAWHERLRLSTVAVESIESIRELSPWRRVGGGAANVRGRYASAKMASTVDFESHTVELPAIYLMESDPEVLEYFAQPPPIPLRYLDRHGRQQRVDHVADFFVLWTTAVGWVEWKTLSRLVELADTSPHRYVKQGTGWRCPPGEAFASELGLRYLLRSDSELNPILVRNRRFLDRYRRNDQPIPASSESVLRRLVAANPGVVISDLIAVAKAELLEVGHD